MFKTIRSCAFGAVLALLAWPAAASASDALDPSPPSLTFADHGIHDSNDEIQRVTFNASAATTVTAVAIEDEDPAQFAVWNDGCTNAVLDSGNWCTVDVQFNPTAIGSHTATLRLTDTTGDTDVPLSGAGITGGLTAQPLAVTFQPQPWYFGGQSQGINLSNPSSVAATQVTGWALTGPDATSFYIAWGDNCSTMLFYAGNGCGLGIGFTPSGPGTFDAQLEVTSDAADSPLTIPITATALAGPRATINPSQLSFGAVPVGQDATLPLTLRNDGDFALQVQQTLLITGRPDIFFVTQDGCSVQILRPGDSCSLSMHFKPASAGEREASLFLIIGNQPRPVESIGVTGTGVAPAAPASGAASAPAQAPAAATLDGRAVAGAALACRTTGLDAAATYSWLRDGSVLPGRAGARLVLRDGDVGARIACAATAGATTVSSAQSAPVRARSLTGLPGAFTDERACRSVLAPATLRLGDGRVTLATGAPSTAATPFTLRGPAGTEASIAGHVLGRGRTLTLGPRALAGLADGAHALRLRAGAASARARIVLAPCRLALDVAGGRRSGTVIGVSARTGMTSLRIRLPRSLRLRAPLRSDPGRASYAGAGYPVRRFALTGARTASNGVTVIMTRREIRVRGLPPETGVVRLRLAPGVLAGRGGSVRAGAALRGDSAPAHARTVAAWTR